jgi:hypothetical protein
MIMTVGPSGAGKTTRSASQGVETVSSEAVRDLIHGSDEAPGDQSGIFRHVRANSARILSKGREMPSPATTLIVRSTLSSDS